MEEPKKSETIEPAVDRKTEEFMKILRDRVDRSVEFEKDERDKGLNDIKFINGDQWEDSVVEQRGKNRLSLTINKMPTFLDQIDGDIRINTPTLKVKAVDDAADTDTADVLEGILRYIQRISRAGKVHAYAGLHAAAGGRGAWRITTDYVSDGSFEQEIKIAKITDAFSVYYDPNADQDDKQDGEYFVVTSPMSKEAYREKYGFGPVDFENDGSAYANWIVDDQVRIAEYFYKEEVEKIKIYQLDDGTVVKEDELQGRTPKSTREVSRFKIKWAKVDGKRILEQGDVPGTMFPIVLTWGKQLCVDGKVETRGIARHAKDSQRLYNYFRSNDAEATALQIKQPYLIPDSLLTDAYAKVWKESQNENFPYLPYKTDPNNPTLRPHREAPSMASSGNREQILTSDNEIKDTVGLQNAALGKQGNETSGIAIQKRKQESDTGQFAFIDNLGDAIITEGRICLSMIPEIYDQERQIRILGKDMKEKVVTINGGAGINLQNGRYDVDINIDGSYSTQREEFQEKINTILPQLPPEHVAGISDLLFEMQDFHRSDDIAQRLKKMIPPEIMENEDELNEEGEPPEPQPPTPEEIMQQADLALKNIELEDNKVKLEQEQVKLAQEQEKLKGMQIENGIKTGEIEDHIVGLAQEMIDGRQ